jgi:CubicO group peptidase (beta-lactamase class C family)
MKGLVAATLLLGAIGGFAACSPSSSEAANTEQTDGGSDSSSAGDGGSDSSSAGDGGSSSSSPGDGGVDSGPSAAETAAFEQLLRDAQRLMTAGFTPGASIAVVLHGKLAFASGIGTRSLASGEAVTTSTLFRAASMSKMIVAATAMTLVDEGKLDLNAPITQYLPWFSLANGFDATKITLNLLLSHSSGFPCDTISQCGTVATKGAREDFFANNPQPLWSPPGSVYDYSNTGFALAATVIEAAAGGVDGDYEALAHDRIFMPAGMTTATFDAHAVAASDHATGYVVDASGKVLATEEPADLDCPLLHPPGGVAATATDYAHFAEMLLAKGATVLKPKSVAAMSSPHADMRALPTQKYGYGLISQTSPYANHLSIWHNGFLPGYLSMLWIVPDRQLGIVVLVNGEGAQNVPDQIVADALKLFIDEPESVPAEKTPPSQWSGYVGTFDDTYGTLGNGVAVSLIPSAGASTLTIAAPNATDFSGNAAPVSGMLTQVAVDTWLMPDGTQATFFPGSGGGFAYLATRRGVGVRE